MISAFPPPVTGAAKNSEIIYKELSKSTSVFKINTSVGVISHERNFVYHLKRLKQLIENCFILMRKICIKKSRVYIVPDGGLGLFYTLIYTNICSIFNAEMVFHYRNYSYIDKKSKILSLCLMLAKNRITHIFLDPYMEKSFINQYGDVKSSLIFLNSAFIENILINVKNGGAILKVGYLSNLCEEKGLYDVIKLIEDCEDLHQRVNFFIAGKAVGKKDMEAINLLSKKYPKAVTYAGEMYGNEKNIFYENSDIFIFPTKYRQEAQPNVIFEAMAQGCVVVANKKGSISWMLEDCGFSINEEKFFSHEAKEIILDFINNPNKLIAYKNKSLEKISNLKIAGKEQYKKAIELMLED